MTPLVVLEGTGSLTRRLALGLKAAVHGGRLRSGAKAPSTRALAKSLGVSRNVVVSAYEELLAEGYFVARGGAGTFVANLPPSQLAPTSANDNPAPLASGAPPAQLSDFGERALAAAAHRTFRDASAPAEIDFAYWQTTFDARAEQEWARLARGKLRQQNYNYPDPQGALELRRAIAEHIAPMRGIQAQAEDILIVNGAQQGLDLAARTLLSRGDVVLIEEPHYQGARQIFEAEGAELRFADVDAGGLSLANVEADACKLVFATPSHQFPTGASMPYARRIELLAWCAERNAWLIEDDFDSEYQHDGRRLAALKALDRDGRVIYLGTFVRSLSLALRIGFVIAPPAVREAIASAKWLTDRGTSEFEQSVLAGFITDGHYERHLRRMGRLYREKRGVLNEALKTTFGSSVRIAGKAAGLHAFVLFKNLSMGAAEEFVELARQRGVGIYPATRYFARTPRHAALMLGYGALAEEHIAEGVRRLSEAYAELVGRKPATRSEAR